jgi:hypothetical protein
MGARAGLDGYGKSCPPTKIRSPSGPYRVAVPAHRLLLVLNMNCNSGIYKGNEDLISFPNRTFHFRNHFLTFREILGLNPNQKLFSSLTP